MPSAGSQNAPSSPAQSGAAGSTADNAGSTTSAGAPPATPANTAGGAPGATASTPAAAATAAATGPAPAATAAPAAAAATANCLAPDDNRFLSGAKVWQYEYVLLASFLFCVFWDFYRRNEWYWWSVVGSTGILLVIYFNVEISAWINDWQGSFFNLLQQALASPARSRRKPSTARSSRCS